MQPSIFNSKCIWKQSLAVTTETTSSQGLQPTQLSIFKQSKTVLCRLYAKAIFDIAPTSETSNWTLVSADCTCVVPSNYSRGSSNKRLPCLFLIALLCLSCSHTSRGMNLHSRWWPLPSLPWAIQYFYKQVRKKPFKSLAGYAKWTNRKSLECDVSVSFPYKCATIGHRNMSLQKQREQEERHRGKTKQLTFLGSSGCDKTIVLNFVVYIVGILLRAGRTVVRFYFL